VVLQEVLGHSSSEAVFEMEVEAGNITLEVVVLYADLEVSDVNNVAQRQFKVLEEEQVELNLAQLAVLVLIIVAFFALVAYGWSRPS
jgi:hypothetical protein